MCAETNKAIAATIFFKLYIFNLFYIYNLRKLCISLFTLMMHIRFNKNSQFYLNTHLNLTFYNVSMLTKSNEVLMLFYFTKTKQNYID